MMKKLVILACSACSMILAGGVQAVERVERGNLVMEDLPAVPAELAQNLKRYNEARGAQFFDWAPGGGVLIGTRFGETQQVHLVQQPLAMRRQLSFYDEPISAASYSPLGAHKGFIFLKDVGGNENAQIYFHDDLTNTDRLLTDGRSLNGSPVWTNDGRQLAFFSNQRNGRSYDVYMVDPGTQGLPRLVFSLDGNAWYPLDFSPDNSKLLLRNFVSINESYLYIGDVNTGKKHRLLPRAEGKRVGIDAARFSRDGRGVYVVSDEDGEFKQLRYLKLTDNLLNPTETPAPATDDKKRKRGAQPPSDQVDIKNISAHIPWDVESFDLSPDGRYLVYVTNEGGMSRLRLMDARNDLPLNAPALPAGRITSARFDNANTKIALSVETARAPRDVWVYEIGPGKLTQWTQSEAGPLDTARFVDAQLVHFPTFDMVRNQLRDIPAFVYKPAGNGPFPVLISIHGGPEAQYRPGFEPFTQFLVNELGFAVIAPNVRGSDGYGRSYLELDNGFKREDSVKDIGALIAWIGVQPQFDRERVMVMGGSYGGYMTLASLVHFGDRLLGGIDVVGISNFLTFLKNTAEYRRDLRRAEYGDERDPEMDAFLRRISPFNNAERIKRPLLVVQGLNDPRVPASESEQMVSVIRGRGGKAGYLMAKDEGHGFRKKQNRDVYLQTVAAFLKELVGKK